METIVQPSQLEAFAEASERVEWRLALQYLALDRVMPLWPELGLSFRLPGLVLEAFRRFVRAERRLPDDGDRPVYARKVRRLTEKLLAEIAEQGGPEEARALCAWFEAACAHEPKWHWMWRILLFHLTRDEGEELRRRGLPEEKALEIVQIGERWRASVDSIESAISRAKQEPLTPWDRNEYRRSQAEVADYDPVDGLLEAFERPRFDRLWARVIGLLDAREVNLLVAWGKDFAAGIEFDQAVPPAARLSPSDAEIPVGWRVLN